MKLKNKGKVSPEPDALSVLSLLPTAILTMVSLLSPQDREVLAYLITRSLKTTTSPTKSPSKRSSATARRPLGPHRAHKSPVFGCECFDCYTSYWFRWDSSPDRELINEAIEAFEDHLDRPKRPTKGKRRARRFGPTGPPTSPEKEPESPASVEVVGEIEEVSFGEVEVSVGEIEVSVGEIEDVSVGEVEDVSVGEVEDVSVGEVEVAKVAATSSHKGLARKVLPDVLGLFNSRLWSLWSPNVY